MPLVQLSETSTNPTMHAPPSTATTSHAPLPPSPSGFLGYASSQPVNRNTIISPWTLPFGFSVAYGSASQLSRHTGVSPGRPFMERASMLQQWLTTEPTHSGRTHGIYSSLPPSVPGASTDSASASGGRLHLPGNSKKAVSLTNYIVCIYTKDLSFTLLPV